MPKDMKEHMEGKQKERNRKKLKTDKYPPTFAYFQVVGQGNVREPRSVFLCTDHKNYLFNCGEGTQRLAAEHHAKLAKTENIFITRPTWNNTGGLPGVALTIQETGIQKLHLHGPEDSIDVIEISKYFMTLNGLTVEPVDNTKQFEDKTMTVDYVLIQKPGSRTPNNNSGPLEENTNFNDCQVKNGKRPHSPSLEATKFMKKQSEMDDLVIFICKLYEKPGTLDINKCNELNVPPGPLLRKLKAGEDVTLDDGTTVKSKDVVSPSDKEPSFIVLECPDEEWMDLIIENENFSKYHNTNEERENVSCIVHFTPEKILNNSRYKEWMYKFGSDTMHLIINEENTGFASNSIYKMQHQLHLIHPTIFPIFFDEKESAEHQFLPKQNFNLDEENLKKIIDCNKEETVENKDLDSSFLHERLKVRRCKALDKFNLRPRNGLNTENNVKIDPKSYIQETMEIDGFLDSLTNLQTEINDKTKALGDDIKEYPKLLMLGTGCSIPNKVRNTSSILFQVDEETSILLDCGEATINQIVKFFSKTEADKILKTIKAIYVSHSHADHHLGLIGLLEYRKNVSSDLLYLIAPQRIMDYLSYYDENNLNKLLDNLKFICNKDILMNRMILSTTLQKEMFETLNISSISTVFVEHCPYAYAVAVTLEDGRKICYSGDTVPCENLKQLARDSFLLIHEATMEDGLESEAFQKRHSTISQAAKIGIEANANFTLLTHFSQRYCKLPLLPDSKQSEHDYSRVGVAYDFMSISLSKLTLLPLFYKTLGLMFNEFRETLYQKATKRNNQKQRLKNSEVSI